MVSVWAADITPLLIEETYQAYYDKVPEWRKDKADKLKNVDDKARSVGAWILWEKMKKVLRLPESAVFNLSHSGKYVLCACSCLLYTSPSPRDISGSRMPSSA